MNADNNSPIPKQRASKKQTGQQPIKGATNFNIQFESDENPFSFYNEGNKRQMSSSEEEDGVEESQQRKDSINLNDQMQTKCQGKGIKIASSPQSYHIQISHNSINQPPINHTPSPQSKSNSLPLQTKPNLQSLKQTQGDLAKLSNSPTTHQKQVDEQYQKQMQRDMQQLKKGLKGKDNKKKVAIFSQQKKQDKKGVKVNLNKTYAPIPKSRVFCSQSNGELQAQQIKMLIKISFQKKKANYQMLKQWDKKRAQNLALHGKMIQLLQNQIDRRIKSSLQNFQYYQSFFREKAKQQQKYCTSPVINTRYALHNNSLSKNVYINCSVILNSLADQNNKRCRKIGDFVQLIRISILKELTENHLNHSQKELLKIRQKISTLKSSLKKYIAQTQQKTSELATFFNQQSQNITKKSDKDFYHSQLSFLRQASQQINVQKKLGEYCLQYYHTAVQQQIKRSQIIRESMLTYSKGLKETYNLELEELQIEQLSKYEQIKLIQQFYSIDDMFDHRCIQIFRIKTSMKPNDQLTIQLFTSYINKFTYDPFDSRVILLKQFNVKHIGSGKNKQVVEENCYLVITVDNFLHLFFSKEKSDAYAKPDVTIKISSKVMQLKMGKYEFIDIVKKEENRNSMMSYFWDSKVEKAYRIRFAKKDNQEEFIDYIRKLMIEPY